MINPFTLEGKKILVTGASSGIGKAVAVECAKLGAILLITGRDKIRLSETYNQLNGKGHRLVLTDLTEENGIESLVAQVDFLDGIVHAAGIADPVPFQYITKQKLLDILSINTISPAILTKMLLNKKSLRKEASIVFISSISGIYCSYVGGSMYSSTKGAINGLMKGMAIDLANKLIRVNSVCPGMIETHILNDGRISHEQLEEDKKRYPLKRYGKPEEVAYAAIFLLSDASKWMTGSNILLDGGYTLL
ncbi:MAG: SDR family NAD(P)-dependent oxidoreductase [Bacteroidales bacterium]|nr:SDR family NAD(P)-dependent oxidoreductase [Bacteroidales bacterium]